MDSDPDSLLSDVANSIRSGGKETLFRPPFFSCAAETHEPFRLIQQPIRLSENPTDADGAVALRGIVQTSSWHFNGDRTDLHDVWSLCWAAFLRASGIASPWLIDEDGWCGQHELSARHLLIHPSSWGLKGEGDYDSAYKAMNAWSAFAYHLLDGVFDWHSAGRRGVGIDTDPTKPAATWLDPVLRMLRHPKDYVTSRRIGPTWIYFSCLPRGITIVRLPKVRMQILRGILAPYEPSTATGENAVAIFANGIVNAVPFRTIKVARRLMQLTGDACKGPMILPIDSHCLYFGDKTLIAIRENCSREIYEGERKSFLSRRTAEDHVFFADSRIEWCCPLDPAAFEDLCLDLLRREPGVRRAKPVGGVNDRDGGRDIIVDWLVPRSHQDADNAESQSVRVLVQIKSRGRTVGKKDVQDIRDTLDRHNAKGFILIVHPRISSALVDHLDDLRARRFILADWWEARDLEGRLRRHPDIARRYPNLVRLVVD